MKIIKNKLLPPKGFFALNLYGIIFVRSDKYEYYESQHPHFIDEMICHESIHTAQMKDFCGFIPIGGTIFYIVYFFEWLSRLFEFNFNNIYAYRAISFEKEAYENDNDTEYLKLRKRFAQWIK